MSQIKVMSEILLIVYGNKRLVRGTVSIFLQILRVLGLRGIITHIYGIAKSPHFSVQSEENQRELGMLLRHHRV
jgi:hypothetical protein